MTSNNSERVAQSGSFSANSAQALRRVAVLIETDTSWGCSVIRGIANFAELNARWHLVLDPRDHEQRSALPDGWEGDGVIIRVSSRMQVQQVESLSVPVVNVGDLREEMQEIPCVATDEFSLAAQAFEHLFDRGFRQFAYFAPPSIHYSKKRGEAFEQVLRENGFECATYRPGYRAGRKIGWVEQQRRVSRWLASLPRPVAILAIDSERGRQLAEICDLTSLRVPDEIAILAGDANDLMCEVSTPPLSHVKVASEKIGYEAASKLQAMMNGNTDSEKLLSIPPFGIVSRHSTDLLAIDDPLIVQALRFIRTNAHHGIVVDDILRDVPISRRHLEIQFKKLLGRAPAKEIRRVQLERGKELLARRELSISEVAQACGFSNTTRFGVAFKKEMNETPLAYRRGVLTGQKNTNSEI